jgi:hypothetical protein
MVWLTPAGTAVLRTIKNLRYEELTFLWKSLNLSASDSKKLTQLIQLAANAAADKMNAKELSK